MCSRDWIQTATQTYKWYNICWLIVQTMRQLLVVCDEVRNINFAIVLLGKDILSYLISVDEDILEVKVKDKFHKLSLSFVARVVAVGGAVFGKHAQRVDGLSIHCRAIGCVMLIDCLWCSKWISKTRPLLECLACHERRVKWCGCSRSRRASSMRSRRPVGFSSLTTT